MFATHMPLYTTPRSDAARTFLFGQALSKLAKKYKTAHDRFERFLHSKVMRKQYLAARRNPVVMAYAEHRAKTHVKALNHIRSKLVNVKTYGLNPNAFPTYHTLVQELGRDMNHYHGLADWFQYQAIVARTK